MPIIRSYACEACAYVMEVTLTADEWDSPPPDCPRCSGMTAQEFVPFAIGGSSRVRAAKITEDILANDYHVADAKIEGKGIGEVPQVRYKDALPAAIPQSTWSNANQEMLEGAAAAGKQVRLRHGSGLDVLASGLKDGTIPDLIAISKRRSLRVF